MTPTDLNDAVVEGVGVQCVLDVTLSHHPQVSHHLDGSFSQHVVLSVAQSLRWGQYDRISRVHTQGVEVLHVAHCDAVVGRITHHLIIYGSKRMGESSKYSIVSQICYM